MFPDPVATPIAEALLECYRAELARVWDPPASVGFRQGVQVDPLLSLTEDECCSGLGWVRVVSIYPSADDSFPNQDDTVNGPCNPRQLAVELELGAVRCAPTPDSSAIPDNEEWAEVFMKVQQDAAAMRRALVCCFGQDPDALWLMGTWNPTPTEGRCAGGTMACIVAADPDCCPPQESP